MLRIALKMLIGQRGKYFGLILGIFFSSMLITQQSAIFVGLVARSFRLVTEIPTPDIWVMNPTVKNTDKVNPMQITDLQRVRSISGIQWAVPLLRSSYRVKTMQGRSEISDIIGVDDASLVGVPTLMLQGKVTDLRKEGAVILDIKGAMEDLATKKPDGTVIPVKMGDILEINNHKAVVVGICKVTPPFYPFPTIYTTFHRAISFSPLERRHLSFILVKAKPGENLQGIISKIKKDTGLKAFTKDQFKWEITKYYLNTGILINFAITVLFGFLIGLSIVGQIFYNFTFDNLRYFAVLKAMGATRKTILKMIVFQALCVGFIGYGLGVGATAILVYMMRNSELAYYLPWQLLIVSAIAVLSICFISATISILKVFRLEPAYVFRI